MAKLAREGSHSYEVRSAATKIVHDVPSKQVAGELAALYRWVRDNIRYRFDPVELEWVQSPTRTMLERAGDCDDMAVLLAALAGSLGHRYRFLTVGPRAGVMKHVAVEVWDGKGWVTLDPVLEPARSSTAPRSDLGKFGQRAPHRARHLWDDGGTMLSGLGAGHTGGRWGRRRPSHVHVAAYDRRWPRSGLSGAADAEGVALWESQLGDATVVHVEPPSVAARMKGPMRRAGLHPRPGWIPRVGPRMARKLGQRACRCRHGSSMAGEVSLEQTELWSWNAYYPSDPNRAPLPAPRAVGTYRSGDAPGFSGGKALVISAPAGTLSGGLGYIGNLGFGFLKKIGKAVGGVVKGAANIVTKIPGVNLVAKMIPGASLALDAAKMVGGMLSPDKKPGAPAAVAAEPQALTAAPGGAPAAPGASPYAPPGSSPVPPVRIPANIAQRSDIDALRQEVRANAGFAKSSDLQRVEQALNAKATAKQQAAQKAAVAKAVKACQKKAKASTKAAVKKQHTKDAGKAAKAAAKAAKKLKKLQGTLAKLRAKPCPAIGQKYPAGAKQRFDVKANKYVVYAPKKAAGAVSGLSGFQDESALGLFKPTLTFTLSGLGAATSKQADAAISAVQAFIAKNKQPPQIAVAAVAAFQKADGSLKPDGLWGPNARAAASFYTGRPVSQLPDVAKPYAKSKITWKPPAAQIAPKAPAVKAAPKAPPAAKKPKAAKAPKASKVVAIVKPAAANYGPAPDVTAKASLLPVTGGQIAPIPAAPDILTEATVSQGGRAAPAVPAPLPPPPAGMRTVGTEDSNPGLPPVGQPELAPAGSVAVATGPQGMPVDEHGRVVIDVSGPRIVQVGSKKKRKRGRAFPPPAFPAPPLHRGGPRSTPWPDDDDGVPHWLWALAALWAINTKPGRRRVA